MKYRFQVKWKSGSRSSEVVSGSSASSARMNLCLQYKLTIQWPFIESIDEGTPIGKTLSMPKGNQLGKNDLRLLTGADQQKVITVTVDNTGTVIESSAEPAAKQKPNISLFKWLLG